MNSHVRVADRAVLAGLGVIAALSAAAVVVYGGNLPAFHRTAAVGATLVFAAVMAVSPSLPLTPADATLGWSGCREL
jgi:hypothetical protein